MSGNNFDFPSNAAMVDAGGVVTPSWLQVMNRWQDIVSSAQQSGITAQRPTSVLWIGRRYFDSTLGKPVYVKSVRPTVWVDGVGTVC